MDLCGFNVKDKKNMEAKELLGPDLSLQWF